MKNNLFKKLLLISICLFLFSACSKKKEEDNTPIDDKATPTYYDASSTTYSSTWSSASNDGVINEIVDTNSRSKYTTILGDNKDVVTLMVYVCGSDLESQYGMAVNDIVEMANANISDNVNVVLYLGGTSKWHFSSFSSAHNMIYKVSGGGYIQPLVENAGSGAMVDPATLTSFIEYCEENFEANRYDLIFWDHGGGSISGYGYDENYSSSGSMDLAGIDRALTDAGVKFDFIGFDACLMATVENALMLSEHADYLIASEETEPGIGWYYTNWLNALSNNTSISTLSLGKIICDDFVDMCNQDAYGQSATLSVVDLSEMESIVPSALSSFSYATNSLIIEDYQTVARARSGSREFSSDSYIDMVDMIDLSNRINNDEAQELTDVLKKAIKYNKTSRDMSNAYGLSIYFPYRSSYYLNDALNVYEQIDMNGEYTNCIRTFATYNTSGQVSSNSYGNSYSFYDDSYDYDYSYESNYDELYQLLDYLFYGNYASNDDYYYYYGRNLDKVVNKDLLPDVTQYIVDNHFDGDLNWKDDKIYLTEKQWSLIDNLKLNSYIDDGEGFLELGKDAIYEIDADGNLLKPDKGYWPGISTDKENYTVCAYYYLYKTIDGDDVIYTGRIPVLLNGEHVNLIVETKGNEYRVLGAIIGYKEGIEVLAKNIYEIHEGDTLQFIADYYDYDGNFVDVYPIGDELTVKDDIYFADLDISDENIYSAYEFIDIYQKSYFSQGF